MKLPCTARLVLFLFLASSNVAAAADVTLAWDSATDGVTHGYIVYIGTATRVYTQQIDVGKVTSYTVTSLLPDTSYFFTVRAYNAANTLSEPAIEVSTRTAPGQAPLDLTAPVVLITSPVGGTVSGAITIAATATDNVGVAGVQFKIDGQNLGAEDIVAPYSATWTTTAIANGTHTLTAIARDAAGNTATSLTTVTVNNVAGSQTLHTTQTPSGQDFSSGTAYELGVRFSTDVHGLITALRYFKGSGESGPHVGRVWSPTGQLLTSVTFANESPSGWQQQALAAPLTIAANTTYTVSVSTGPAGHYVATTGFFGVPLDNAPLHAEAGYNGVYGPAGAFPVATYQAANYFRDVVFAAGTAPDLTAPTIVISAPPNGGTVVGSVQITATATDNVGVAGVQFKVDGQNLGPEDTVAPYNATWNTTTWPNGTHTLTATARDQAGLTSTATVTTTVNNAELTLFTTQVPTGDGFAGAYELGLRFMSDVPGSITALRFWKGTGDSGTHIGHVWSATGALLATVTFVNETPSGWQQQALTTPIAIPANTEYVVSVSTGGAYVATTGFFDAPLVRTPLRSAPGAAGVYGPLGLFPATPYQNANYFRDLVFVPASSPLQENVLDASLVTCCGLTFTGYVSVRRLRRARERWLKARDLTSASAEK